MIIYKITKKSYCCIRNINIHVLRVYNIILYTNIVKKIYEYNNNNIIVIVAARSYVQTSELFLRHHRRERRVFVGEQHVVGHHARCFQPLQHQLLEPRQFGIDAVVGRVLPFPTRQQYHVLGVVTGRPRARGHLCGQLVNWCLA